MVIAACSPEVHEHLFRDCVAGAGLNRYLVDIANIREQCAWVKSETDPTDKAIDIVRSSIYALRHAQPREKIRLSVNRDVLVIGGGIAGISAALSLARQGIKVCLVEKSASIGGNMVKIGKVFSPDKLTEECAMCSLAPILSDVENTKNIELLTLTDVVGMEGHAGDFHVRVSTGPALVDSKKCISCGRCSEVCSVSVPDEWNANLSERKAISPFPRRSLHPVPSTLMPASSAATAWKPATPRHRSREGGRRADDRRGRHHCRHGARSSTRPRSTSSATGSTPA